MFGIQAYQTEIKKLCQQFNVEELSVFGSALREDFDNTQSDIDFIVTFKPMEPVLHARAYFGLAEALETLLGRKVDLLSFKAVRNPYIRAEIEKTREPLYVG
jgi:uncharacterized protein